MGISCPSRIQDALCSIWYYRDFKVLNDWHDNCWNSYMLLEKHGFDQVPTGSNVVMHENLEHIVNHTKKTISPEHLEGFLITTWKAMRKKTNRKFLKRQTSSMKPQKSTKTAYTDNTRSERIYYVVH